MDVDPVASYQLPVASCQFAVASQAATSISPLATGNSQLATPSVSPIDYAPPLPAYRRRRVRRLAALVVLLAIAIPVTIKSAPPAWRRVKLLYWQRQAMRYSAPPTQIVDPGKPDQASIIWQKYSELASPPGAKGQGTLFLHELRNSRGESRLVAIEGRFVFRTASSPRGGVAFILWATTFRPAGLFSPACELSSGPIEVAVFSSTAATSARWFAGQPDPSNPYQLTIVYQVNGKRHVVDGVLRDDDWVVLSAH